LPVSAKTGAGIDGVVEALVQRVRSEFGETGGLVTRARHRQALTDCEACLGRALAVDGSRPEILAEELRLAARALGRLLGRIDIEDLLDVIFREFCIGK
jgi:tRNA modification GTPase